MAQIMKLIDVKDLNKYTVVYTVIMDWTIVGMVGGLASWILIVQHVGYKWTI